MSRGRTSLLTGLIMLLLLTAMPSAWGLAAGTPPTLTLSAAEVLRGEVITVSGAVTDGSDEVMLKIVSPNRTVFYIDVLSVKESSYTAAIRIPSQEEQAPLGTYTIVVGRSGSEAAGTFAVVTEKSGNGGAGPGGGGDNTGTNPGNGDGGNSGVNPGGGGTNPGNGGAVVPPTGGTGGTDNGTTPAPAGEQTAIEAAAGQAAGGRITPLWTTGGEHVLGADTMKAALTQAQNASSVTISLTAETDAPLRMPAEALAALQQSGKALTVEAGAVSVTFPAGALNSSADNADYVRLSLQTASTPEGQAMLSSSVKNQPELTSTGILLTLNMDTIQGDAMTAVHQFSKPLQITVELTDAQQKGMQKDLAGAYYIDGSKADYAGGLMRGSMLLFTTTHFSYYAVLEYNKEFKDMSGHWAAADVKSLAAKQLVQGVSETTFLPARSVTRAEFAAFMMRMLRFAGQEGTGGSKNPFTDIAADQYYAQDAADAAALGIVSGYNGKFRPQDSITRQEATVMLMKAHKLLGAQSAASGTAAAKFTDANRIAAWAAPSVNESAQLGLLQGDNGRFRPLDSMTRAEAVAVINRLLKQM